MTAQTIAIMEAYLNEREPESIEPEPLASVHCGDTCGDPRCHYQCDPRTCIEAAYESMRDSFIMDEPECDVCNGPCTL